jgi:hypothetical protein
LEERESERERESAASGSGLCLLVSRWRAGQMSNFDYLLALNHLVGRFEGNRRFNLKPTA